MPVNAMIITSLDRPAGVFCEEFQLVSINIAWRTQSAECGSSEAETGDCPAPLASSRRHC